MKVAAKLWITRLRCRNSSGYRSCSLSPSDQLNREKTIINLI